MKNLLKCSILGQLIDKLTSFLTGLTIVFQCCSAAKPVQSGWNVGRFNSFRNIWLATSLFVFWSGSRIVYIQQQVKVCYRTAVFLNSGTPVKYVKARDIITHTSMYTHGISRGIFALLWVYALWSKPELSYNKAEAVGERTQHNLCPSLHLDFRATLCYLAKRTRNDKVIFFHLISHVFTQCIFDLLHSRAPGRIQARPLSLTEPEILLSESWVPALK